MLRTRCADTTNQVSVARKLKTDLHVTRMRDLHDKCESTMTEINTEIATLIPLGEPDTTLTQYDDWEKLYTKVSKDVKDAEEEIGTLQQMLFNLHCLLPQPTLMAGNLGCQRPTTC